ncbi:MAG: phosphodiester glycosidase family protein [Veillonella sp.]|uniref:phosphodiester glycosidase family protein n=1 Tax=Veillonella sp. TaxID=1926307 RepID=UPI0025EB9C7E|nr:phosphodiester glycosidase family protein [Veillonella sp.]MBS4913567.1 phosphodiester glycosidase family protein [Veillonella sp.]
MTGKFKAITLVLAGLAMQLTAAEAADVTSLRALNEAGHTRVVFDMKGLPDGWSSIYNNKNEQVKLHLPGTTNVMTGPVDYNRRDTGVLRGVELQSKGDDLDVTLTVNQSVRHHIFSLTNPDRLVVDLFTDYNQKTTRTVGEGVTFSKWDTSSENGRVKAYVMEANPNVPMRIGDAGTVGKSLANVQPPFISAIGLEKGQSKTTNALAAGASNTSYKQWEPQALLKYVPEKGYSISFALPRLEVNEGNDTLAVSGVNRERLSDELILYTRSFGNSTRTNVYGQEVTIKDNVVVSKKNNNSPLTADSIVLSGHGTMAKKLEALKVGDTVRLTAKPDVVKISNNAAVVYSGGQQILAQGTVMGQNDGILTGRTFIGVDSSGRLIVLAIDGSQGVSVGATTSDGANMLKSLGATDGIELTGQGAADMYSNTYLHTGQKDPSLYQKNLVLG